MMLLSSNIAAILVLVSPILPFIGWECRTVSLIVYFIFMVALVMSFSCDQVALLQIVLSLVA
jgi:hypothetical protein